MHQKLFIAVFVLGALIVSATPAMADFLGLAPGDYTVTLQGSSSLCDGSDCVGTVHIGTPDATGFDWLFENVGPSDIDFDFSPPGTATSIFPTLEVADETNASTTLRIFSDGRYQFLPPCEECSTNGRWVATPLSVPEPATGLLLLFGLGALGLWRRFRAKQD